MKGGTSKKTLLIIDDVELFIQLHVSYLGSKRYNIHTASSGNQGLEKARSLKPDLILLDLLMQDMNGDQVCRTLKSDPETSSIRIVLVSSGTREQSKSIISSSGCDGLIFKPVRRDLLLSVVENLLQTNARVFERAETSIPCTIRLEGKEYHGTIHSLSGTGAFVEFTDPAIRGDLMELEFTLPEPNTTVNVRAGAVVWCGSLGENGPKGAGIQFLTISSQSQQDIDDFVMSKIRTEVVLGVDG